MYIIMRGDQYIRHLRLLLLIERVTPTCPASSVGRA